MSPSLRLLAPTCVAVCLLATAPAAAQPFVSYDYAGDLGTAPDGQFDRPALSEHGCTLAPSGTGVAYQADALVLGEPRTLRGDLLTEPGSVEDGFAIYVYEGAFDPEQPCQNLAAASRLLLNNAILSIRPRAYAAGVPYVVVTAEATAESGGAFEVQFVDPEVPSPIADLRASLRGNPVLAREGATVVRLDVEVRNLTSERQAGTLAVGVSSVGDNLRTTRASVGPGGTRRFPYRVRIPAEVAASFVQTADIFGLDEIGLNVAIFRGQEETLDSFVDAVSLPIPIAPGEGSRTSGGGTSWHDLLGRASQGDAEAVTAVETLGQLARSITVEPVRLAARAPAMATE